MKRLVLCRHAKASRDDPRLPDADRPLTARGARDAPEVGRRLVRRGIVPDAVVASPARRARETARLVAGALGIPEREIRLERRVYGAEAGELLDVVRETGDRAASLLLVGHNPGMTDLARTLLPGFTGELPTCGIVVIDLAVDRWARARAGGGSLVAYEAP